MRHALVLGFLAFAAIGSANKAIHVYVFLKDGCPHTKVALPALRQLSDDLRGKAAVQAFITAPHKSLEVTRKNMATNFALIADPDGERIRKFGGKHSLDILVVQGKDRVLFDGFGPKAIAEIAKRTGVKLTNKAYPKKRLSGCGI